MRSFAPASRCSAVLLGRDVAVHEQAETRRVHVGRLGQVKDEHRRLVLREVMLEVEGVLQGERSLELEDGDALSASWCGGHG
jgi:hypothetical protein